MTKPKQTQTDTAGTRVVKKRRSWGKIRKLPSGNYQASYVDPQGQRVKAPTTFFTKSDANAWLSMQHAEIYEHRWKPSNPNDRQQPLFSEYAKHCLNNRVLSPKTRNEYERHLDGRLSFFGPYPLDRITPKMVKEWFNEQGNENPSERKHAYDLLRSIFNDACKDDLDTDEEAWLAKNPARLTNKTLNRGMTKKEMKPATLDELETIIHEMPKRYEAMTLVAVWCGIRFGELTELRRKDIEIFFNEENERKEGTLHIRRAVTWSRNIPIVKEPKSTAGARDVAIPPHIIHSLLKHIEKYAEPGPEGLVFPAVEGGGHMRSGALYKVYRRARKVAGRPDLRWHDLRHTAATMAAQKGATLAELMRRLGHSSPQAAMIYQHATDERDKAIAEKLSEMAARINK
ncbi:tyrosine-type recombinase/integrase [Propionimicrobium lymphophilum]|nr:site-specific integrase [Propionimicrobium lymphophilum]